MTPADVRRNIPRLLHALVLVLCTLATLVSVGRAAESYTAQQIRADINELEAGIAATHPNLSHSVDPARLSLALDALRQRAVDGLDRDAVWRELSTLNPALADGHLFVGYADWREETVRHLQGGGALFPFEIRADADGSIRVLSELGGGPTALAGIDIEVINGIPAAAVAAELLARVHGDSPRFRAELLSRRWWFFYWKMYGAPLVFDLTLAGPSATQLRKAGSRKQPSIMDGESDFDRQFSLDLLQDGAAVLAIKTFSWAEPTEFFDFALTSFQQMKAAGTRTLIIDVRQNGGGDDAMWLQGLLPYIADKPYRWASRYTKKVVKENPAKMERMGEVLSGVVDSWTAPRANDPYHFDGKVYVLVGPATYSSAVLFANTMQDFGFGIIVGEGSSVRSAQTGGVQKIGLPHTGLALWSPRFLLVRPSGEDEPIWLTPDVLLEDDPMMPGATVDAVLAIDAAKRLVE